MLAPCALGAVLDEDTVPLLRCRAIAGAANNQLADDAVGELLAARDILWVPDFVANAGGVVNIAVELEPEGYAIERAETRVRAVADTVRTVLDHADATGATPLAAAMEIAHRRVAEAHARRLRRARTRWVGRGSDTARRPPLAGVRRSQLTHAWDRRVGSCPLRGPPSPSGLRSPAAAPTRPSARSFSRCARSDIAANGRSSGGASSQAASSRSSSVAQAALERREQPPFAVEPVVDVGVELRPHVPHRRAVAGAQHVELERAQAAQAVEVAGEVAGHEHAALAEHGVAGERRAAGDERQVVVGVPRQRDRAQRAERVAVRGARPRRRHRQVGAEPHAQAVDARPRGPRGRA